MAYVEAVHKDVTTEDTAPAPGVGAYPQSISDSSRSASIARCSKRAAMSPVSCWRHSLLATARAVAFQWLAARRSASITSRRSASELNFSVERLGKGLKTILHRHNPSARERYGGCKVQSDKSMVKSASPERRARLRRQHGVEPSGRSSNAALVINRSPERLRPLISRARGDDEAEGGIFERQAHRFCPHLV